MTEPRIVHEGGAILGEGPVYDPSLDALWWVDIKARRLHRTGLADGARADWLLPSQPGCLALEPARGAVILAMEDGIFRFDPATEALARISPLAPGPGTLRFNDGKTDPQGRLWVGDLDDREFPPTGTLYMVHPDGRFEPRVDGLRCTNGIGWTADGRRMFHTDSMARTIWSFDFEMATGRLSNRTVFARIDPPAVPDGLAVDVDGCVWSAQWDGRAIVRYAPDGSVLLRVPLPITRPTSCAFGGPGLGTLYVTSASIGLSDNERSAQDGALFALQGVAVGVPVAGFGVPLDTRHVRRFRQSPGESPKA
jgi:sugar lactone lactonase YvrE